MGMDDLIFIFMLRDKMPSDTKYDCLEDSFVNHLLVTLISSIKIIITKVNMAKILRTFNYVN